MIWEGQLGVIKKSLGSVRIANREPCHIPYTARAFSFARTITSAGPHPPPTTPAANSATHGIMAVWQSGSLPLSAGRDA